MSDGEPNRFAVRLEAAPGEGVFDGKPGKGIVLVRIERGVAVTITGNGEGALLQLR